MVEVQGPWGPISGSGRPGITHDFWSTVQSRKVIVAQSFAYKCSQLAKAGFCGLKEVCLCSYAVGLILKQKLYHTQHYLTE